MSLILDSYGLIVWMPGVQICFYLCSQVATSINNASCTAALSTLMSMANDLDETELSENSVRPKNIELEGRGSVPCHIW
jgi:hypothetical protein